MIMSQGWSPHEWGCCFSKRVPSKELSHPLFLPCEDVMRGLQSAAMKRSSTELKHADTLISDSQPLELEKINLCCL